MIHLTHHAVDQYHERVKPAMLRSEAHLELEALAERAEVVRERPSWTMTRRRTEAWAIVSDGVALALVMKPNGWLATTCIVREGRRSALRRRAAALQAREVAA